METIRKSIVQKFTEILCLVFILLLVKSGRIYSQDYRWQMRVHYQMDVRLDPSKHQLTGKQEVILYNGSNDTLNKVYYHLYWNAFQPGSDMDVRSR